MSFNMFRDESDTAARPCPPAVSLGTTKQGVQRSVSSAENTAEQMDLLAPGNKHPLAKENPTGLHVPSAGKYRPANYHYFGHTEVEQFCSAIRPLELKLGGKDWQFIIFDTETCRRDSMLETAVNDGRSHVRRWVEKRPQETPFVITVSDGLDAWCLRSDRSYKTAGSTPQADKAPGAWDKEAIKLLQDVFNRPAWTYAAFNLNYDRHMLDNIQVPLQDGQTFDIQLAAKLVEENLLRSGQVEYIKHFKLHLDGSRVAHPSGVNIPCRIDFEDDLAFYKRQHRETNYSKIFAPLLNAYACADVINAAGILTRIAPDLDIFYASRQAPEYLQMPELGITNILELENRTADVAYHMERTGMHVSMEKLSETSAMCLKAAADAEQALYEATGKEFNIGSAKQLHEALHAAGVPDSILQFTPKGNLRTDSKTLEELATNHPEIKFLQNISTYKHMLKLHSSYCSNIELMAQEDAPGEYRIHPSINTLEAVTGRMSITNPALQTIPRAEKTIKYIFTPTPGYKLVYLDYAQVEYRLLAYFAQEAELCRSINAGHDVHTATTVLLWPEWKDKVDQIPKETRFFAKTTNFCLVYGQGEKAFADRLGVDLLQAKSIRATYWKALPKVEPLLAKIRADMKKHRVIYTIFNRPRHYTSYYSAELGKKIDNAYKSPNSLLQGSSADITKLALCRIQALITEWENISAVDDGGSCVPYTLQSPTPHDADNTQTCNPDSSTGEQKSCSITIRPGDIRLVNVVHDELQLEVKEELLRPPYGASILSALLHACRVNLQWSLITNPAEAQASTYVYSLQSNTPNEAGLSCLPEHLQITCDCEIAAVSWGDKEEWIPE